MPKAFTRAVSPRLAECELTHQQRVPLDVVKAVQQHATYEDALRGAGFEVIRLPDLPDNPDGVFVEDTALLLVTFFLTVIFDMVVGVGADLALAFFFHKAEKA